MMGKFSTMWNGRFLNIAREVASWSKDTSSKVGCVIVDSEKSIKTTGYNGLPRGVDDTVAGRNERPEKYRWFSHAEANAISNCSRMGVSSENCVIYVTHPPCAACARSIVQAGISEVVIPKESLTEDFLSRWGEEYEVSKQMFSEAGVRLIVE